MKREAMHMYDDLISGNSSEYEKDNTPPSTPYTSSSQEEDEFINLDSPMTRGSITSDEIERPEGRKAAKGKKRRLNEGKDVADALNKLQGTLESYIVVIREQLELKREEYKKDFELKEHYMKRKLELKENALELKEKVQRRRQQECILSLDVNKLPLTSQKEFDFEMWRVQILKEWEKDLFAKNCASN